MTIRDLGYSAYEGVRNPPSHNSVVLLRHCLRESFSSWLVKTALFLSWLPPLIGLGTSVVQSWLAEQARAQGADIPLPSIAEGIHLTYGWQMWLFAFMVSLGGGATTIADDLTRSALPFYFSKPVTPKQYLTAKISAVSIWIFVLYLLPAVAFPAWGARAVPAEDRLETFGLLLPALVYAALIAVALGVTSVGVSALGKGRALAMSTWILLFAVPWVLAAIVDAVGDWPWLKLASLPALLSILGGELLRLPREDGIAWYHALGPVVAFVVLGAAFAYRRISTTEVIE